MYKSKFKFLNMDFVFHVINPSDAIQKRHLAGEFFDHKELLLMSEFIRDGDLILDIGSNVGNHAVFFSKIFPASRVMVFEPNPEAISLLNVNLLANYCVNVDIKYLGFGLSDVEENALSWRGGENNLGGSRVIPMQDLGGVAEKRRKNFSEIKLIRGDTVLADKSPKFMKIDVEGHELKVLAGLDETIDRCRPNIFIEISNGNTEIFKVWLKRASYEIVWVDSHYAKVTNYMCIPRDGV